jgi:glycerol-3-phosphate acyltransferase PlsY
MPFGPETPFFWPTAAAIAFLCGSIPFGLLIARAKGIDIRKHGSGNIGATNVGRVLGRRYFFLCFALDFLKGFLPTLVAGILAGIAGSLEIHPTDSWRWLAVMVAAVLGHIFSPWLKFKGGKGVATSLGALLAVFPHLTLPASSAFLVWLITLAITRYISASSIAAGISLPIFVTLWWYANTHSDWLGEQRAILADFSDGWPYIIVSTILGALVIYTHRSNIKRLVAGTENRVGRRLTAQQ